MRKIEETAFHQTVNGVKLFRDDIEAILDCCNDQFSIEFSDSKNVYLIFIE